MIVFGLIVAILSVPGLIRLGTQRFAAIRTSAYAHTPAPAVIDHPPQSALQRIVSGVVSINRLITFIYSIVLGAITATATTMFYCVNRRSRNTWINVPPVRRSLAGFTRWMSNLAARVLIVSAIILSIVGFALVHAAVNFAIAISTTIAIILVINIESIVRLKELRLATVRATTSNDFSTNVGNGANKRTSRWHTCAHDDEERHPRNQRTRPTHANARSAGRLTLSTA